MAKRLLIQVVGLGIGLAMLGNVVALEPKVMAETPPVWYNCLTREVFSAQKRTWCDRWKTLQNTTYIVPTSLDSHPEYTPVTLNNGRYQRKDGNFFVELVNERNWLTFGDLNDDGKQDAAVIFGVALDPNGKSVATYLTAVLNVDSKPRALTPIRLGERIMLNGPIIIRDRGITVPFLTQKAAFDRVYVIHETLQERS